MAAKEGQKSRLRMTCAQNDSRHVDRGTVPALHPGKNAAAELARMNRRKNGHPFAYSETLIISIATIRAVCGIPYRMCRGLAQEALGRENAPDFTTLQKRTSRVDATLVNGHSGIARSRTSTVRVIPDGTGMTGPNWISSRFFKAAIDAGIQKRTSHRVYRIHSHEARDLLKSTLLVSGCAQHAADHVLGHAPRDSYEKQAVLYPKALRSEYAKASGRLNIFSSIEKHLRAAGADSGVEAPRETAATKRSRRSSEMQETFQPAP